MSYTIRERFQKAVKGRNFMTPHIHKHMNIKNGCVEVSYGEGIMPNTTIWGVTVVQHGKHDHDLSKAFSSKEEALAYVETLR